MNLEQLLKRSLEFQISPWRFLLPNLTSGLIDCGYHIAEASIFRIIRFLAIEKPIYDRLRRLSGSTNEAFSLSQSGVTSVVKGIFETITKRLHRRNIDASTMAPAHIQPLTSKASVGKEHADIFRLLLIEPMVITNEDLATIMDLTLQNNSREDELSPLGSHAVFYIRSCALTRMS